MISSRLTETAAATASCSSLYSAPIIMKFLFLEVGFYTATTDYKDVFVNSLFIIYQTFLSLASLNLLH